jgi:hypothetical protein
MNDETRKALDELSQLLKADDRLQWSEKNLRFTDRFDYLVFHRAGGACPVQAEGSYKGEPFYFRYRWGFASLGLGGDPVMNPEYESSMSYGQAFDGFLSLGEFKDIFTRLLQLIIREKAGRENVY